MSTIPYRPKIKIDTIRNVAQKMAATKAGKVINTTAFKKFLKHDKDLHALGYRPGSAKITKQTAKKFLGTAAEKIAHSDKMKLSLFARKSGIKNVDSHGPSETGIKKVLGAGVKEEISHEIEQGPSPEDVRHQKRLEKARTIMHQRDRADDIRKETESMKKTTDSASKNTTAFRPPQFSSGGVSALPSSSGRASQVPGFRVQSAGGSTGRQMTNAILVPFHNLSQMRELTILGTKLEETVRRALAGVSSIGVLPRVQTIRFLQNLGWTPSRIIPPEFAKRLAKDLGVRYVFYGTITHEHGLAYVRLMLLVAARNSILLLAEVREDFHNTFEVEEKLSWQVQNFFDDSGPAASEHTEVDIPSAADAIDLPL
ncbi:MAG: hypothetical protein WC289_05340 [Patescibacteria group bacterium]|jgi:TolB-like protein